MVDVSLPAHDPCSTRRHPNTRHTGEGRPHLSGQGCVRRTPASRGASGVPGLLECRCFPLYFTLLLNFNVPTVDRVCCVFLVPVWAFMFKFSWPRAACLMPGEQEGSDRCHVNGALELCQDRMKRAGWTGRLWPEMDRQQECGPVVAPGHIQLEGPPYTTWTRVPFQLNTF